MSLGLYDLTYRVCKYSPSVAVALQLVEDYELTGTISTELGLLTNLEELSLRNTRIGGTIPSELGRFTSTDFWLLNLADMALTGTIPMELYSLRVKQVGLHQNMLEGTIGTEIGLAANLCK